MTKNALTASRRTTAFLVLLACLVLAAACGSSADNADTLVAAATTPTSSEADDSAEASPASTDDVASAAGDQPAGAPGGPGGAGGPDLTEAAAALGVDVDELTVALGQPPFDIVAAAELLGIDADALEAAIPPPPAGGPGGARPAPGAAATDDAATNDDAATDEAAADDAATADSSSAGADEIAARTAAVTNALWADNVTITIDGTTVNFQSNGLPAHEYLDIYLGDGQDGKFVAGGVDAYNASFSFPLVPTPASSPTETPNGAIGVAISGAVFFDPYEGNGTDTVANDDNETIDGIPFIDACGGHPLPTGQSYHYHGIPFCITDALDTVGQHSTLIGYLFDGYPIYGPQDTDGAEPTDLDACLGHVGETADFDDEIYHYHVTSTANYISECFTGVATTTGRS